MALAAAIQAATFTALLEAADDRTAAVDAALDALRPPVADPLTRGTA